MQIKLPISSVGMVTALGHSAVHVAAAHRAGLNLSRALPGFTIEGGLEDESNITGPLAGHRISPLTDGFLQTGLWIRVAVEVLRDAIDYGHLPPPADTAFWRRTALFVVVPDVTSDRFGWPDDEIASLVGDRYVGPLSGILGLDLAFAPSQIAFGHAGWAAAAAAAKDILGRSVDRAILLGVDSYVDPLSLTVLGAAERLKTPDTPTGLIPGEAGACFLMERSSRRPEAWLLAAHHARTPMAPPGEDDDPTAFLSAVGRQLADAIAAVLAGTTPRAFAGDVYLDLNGEEWRARVWSSALLRLRGLLDLERWTRVLPCASFGEIGAASGPLAVGLCVRAFVRGYARGDQAMVLSVSERGDVAAALVGKHA